MKSMRPPLAAIFFMTYFHRARGGHGPLGPPWIRYWEEETKHGEISWLGNNVWPYIYHPHMGFRKIMSLSVHRGWGWGSHVSTIHNTITIPVQIQTFSLGPHPTVFSRLLARGWLAFDWKASLFIYFLYFPVLSENESSNYIFMISCYTRILKCGLCRRRKACKKYDTPKESLTSSLSMIDSVSSVTFLFFMILTT